MVRAVCFYTRFAEEQTVVGKHHGTKHCEIWVVDRGNWARPLHLDSSWEEFLSGDKDASFLQVERGHLRCGGPITYFREKEEVKEYFWHLMFLFPST